MFPHLGAAAKTKRGSNLGSDHLPMHIEIQVKAYLSIGKAPTGTSTTPTGTPGMTPLIK